MDQNSQAVSKVTVPAILDRKLGGGKLTCLTAYDFSAARLVDQAGVDIVLVGDSLAQTMLGYDSTVPVTLDEMLHHLKAVRRGVHRALLVGDLPFGSYHVSNEQALAGAIRYIKEGGAEAVKLEGGRKRARLVRELIDAEIPVMGHIGLTPQSINTLGAYRVQGKTFDGATEMVADAEALEEAGVFAIVLEGIPRELAAIITRRLRIPTIGIGAGPDCDGQILVFHDLVGLSSVLHPKFVRSYANLRETLYDAITRFRIDVEQGCYPDDRESYHWSAAVRQQFEKEFARPA